MEWDHDDCISTMDFSRLEGSLLSVVTTAGKVYLYDTRSESAVRNWKVDPSAHYAQFVKDDYVVVVSPSEVRMYDIHDGRLWAERTKDYRIRTVCASPNQNDIVLYDDQQRLHCMNIVTGEEEIEPLGVDADITALHRTGDTLAAAHASGHMSFYQF